MILFYNNLSYAICLVADHLEQRSETEIGSATPERYEGPKDYRQNYGANGCCCELTCCMIDMAAKSDIF